MDIIFVHEKLCACMCQSGENSLLAYNVKRANVFHTMLVYNARAGRGGGGNVILYGKCWKCYTTEQHSTETAAE